MLDSQKQFKITEKFLNEKKVYGVKAQIHYPMYVVGICCIASLRQAPCVTTTCITEKNKESHFENSFFSRIMPVVFCLATTCQAANHYQNACHYMENCVYTNDSLIIRFDRPPR